MEIKKALKYLLQEIGTGLMLALPFGILIWCGLFIY